MNHTNEYSPEYVKRAAADLLAVRPGYRDLIGFYADIFAAQEEIRPQIRLEASRLDPELIRTKLKEHFPLIPPPQMPFDLPACRKLFVQLCGIAVERGSSLAGAAGILLRNPPAAADLFRRHLEGDEEHIQAVAGALDVPGSGLSFFIYHSLRPSICRRRQDLAELLADDIAWEKGYCPICGSTPGLAWLEADGRRFFFCSFCWHRWAGRRTVCPGCDTSDPRRLAYTYSEEEKEYRIDVCDACRRYIKTVDGRNLSRPAYPPLEHIASLHLDLQAVEAGFTSGSAAFGPS